MSETLTKAKEFFANPYEFIKKDKSMDCRPHFYLYAEQTQYLITELIDLLTVSERCQSPVELMLFWAFVECWQCETLEKGGTYLSPTIDGLSGWGIYIEPQYEINIRGNRKLRVDFCVYRLNKNDIPEQIVIEVDGHDFHEKTKEQAQRDKRRDRILISMNYKVLRFTGSEVYKNPVAVIKEIEDVIKGRSNDSQKP